MSGVKSYAFVQACRQWCSRIYICKWLLRAHYKCTLISLPSLCAPHFCVPYHYPPQSALHAVDKALEQRHILVLKVPITANRQAAQVAARLHDMQQLFGRHVAVAIGVKKLEDDVHLYASSTVRSCPVATQARSVTGRTGSPRHSYQIARDFSSSWP